MSKIYISPYSRKIDGMINAKSYAYWDDVITELKKEGHTLIQLVFVDEVALANVDEIVKDIPFPELEKELKAQCDVFIAVDNFLPHLCANIGVPGVAIFTVSDPDKFGRKANKNLIKNKVYLRPDQYGTWNDCKYNADASIEPEKVLQVVKEILATKK